MNTIITDKVIKRDDQIIAPYSPIDDRIMSLDGKRAVVTGGGSGIGRAIAIGLSKFGASVAVVDLNRVSAEETAKHIVSMGGKSHSFEADVSDLSSVSRMIDEAMSVFGGIDILVNNAGIGSGNDFPDVSPKEWQRVIKINLDSVFYCTKLVSEIMIKQKSGAIINIGSSLSSRGAALNCSGGSAEYCVSKSGVQALTRSAAQYLAPKGIRVNSVAPGPCDSPMHSERREALAAELGRVPLGRIQVCDDLVGPVVFLASDAARFVTGQTLHVNGGLLMVD